MLMLLSMHVTSVLFLVRFNNFALTTGFYWSYTLLLKSPVLMHSCIMYTCIQEILIMQRKLIVSYIPCGNVWGRVEVCNLFSIIAECFSVSLIIVQAQQVLVECQSEVMLVCLFVTILRLNKTGPMVYEFTYLSGTYRSWYHRNARRRTGRLEDDSRLKNKSRDIEDG